MKLVIFLDNAINEPSPFIPTCSATILSAIDISADSVLRFQDGWIAGIVKLVNADVRDTDARKPCSEAPGARNGTVQL
jgi:hypothetical protein